MYSVVGSSFTVLIVTRAIKRIDVLANRMGGLFRLGPCNRLVAGEPLHLVHIRLDQARIDRERFTSDEPRRNAHCHHTFEYPAQGIALTEAFAPSPTEHRMIRDIVFDPEFAEPPVG